MAAPRDENSVVASWRNALKNEKTAARDWPTNWGFLVDMDKSDDAQQHGYARIPVQYVGRSGPTVEMKRVPILPSQQQAADQARATLSSGGTGPGSGRSVTAMESVHLSHTQQLDRIKTADPHFKRSSDTYGSRKPIEQFGISHHGVKQSAITNWYRRDMGQI